MKKDREGLAIFVVVMTIVILIFGGLIGYMFYDDHQNALMEKVCVASGKLWYSNDNGGNCVRK